MISCLFSLFKIYMEFPVQFIISDSYAYVSHQYKYRMRLKHTYTTSDHKQQILIFSIFHLYDVSISRFVYFKNIFFLSHSVWCLSQIFLISWNRFEWTQILKNKTDTIAKVTQPKMFKFTHPMIRKRMFVCVFILK